MATIQTREGSSSRVASARYVRAVASRSPRRCRSGCSCAAVALVFARTADRHARNSGRRRKPSTSPVSADVRVQHGVRMMTQIPPPQVHQQEREIVEHVGARNLVVEFDAVEQRRISVDQHDVP